MRPDRSSVSHTRVSAPSVVATLAVLLALLASLVVTLAPSASYAAVDGSIEVVSTRPEMVSGGDALVAVTLPTGASDEDVRVLRGGEDVTDAFQPHGAGWLGLVDGLADGDDLLELVLLDDDVPTDPTDPGDVDRACGPAVRGSGFVDATGPHARAIDCLVAHGVTVGVSDTHFGTVDPLRRRQLALMVVRTLENVPGFELPSARPEAFTDLAVDAFADAIATLAGFDPAVVQGYADGTFRPAETLTRGQFASILLRVDDELVARYDALAPLPPVTSSPFPDVRHGDPHGPTILRLAGADIIRGYADGTFGAQRPVTRGQLATLLVGVLDRWASAGVLPQVGGETVPAGGETAEPPEGQVVASLPVTNHPLTGPIFSGPHQEPFVCTTAAWGLGEPLDDDCSAPTQVSWRYRTTGGAWAEWPADDARPSDLATTEVNGEAVDYIVRLERGTINRAIYEIASLGDPQVPGTDSPLFETLGTAADNPLWNGRLVYSFGGGCNAGYHQGPANNPIAGGGILDHTMLRQGYAVATSTLNVNQNNCNDVLSAETALMVKEHVIETYGPIVHTIGWGGSGGAIQQHLIAENYPGILDGIVPQMSFPDNFSIAPGVVDCRLLNSYFNRGGDWSDAERMAVSGFASQGTCGFWNIAFSTNIVPTSGCDPVVGADHPIYHPIDAPDGVRCTMLDHAVNLLGRDPDTGFARNPFDNQGVQYGLAALEAGDLSVDRFLDLNEGIGGYDVDANNVPERSAGDDEALRRILEGGRVITGERGLAEVPILDTRAYTDPTGDIHDSYRSHTVRARLQQANGHADNHVMWLGDPADMAERSLGAMDAWLTAIGADDRDLPRAELVVRNKPADLVDGCWLPDGTRVDEPLEYGVAGTCLTRYPTHESPRIVAGMPGPIDEIAACVTTEPQPEDYDVTFTTDQWDRLLSIFPDGVCDWEAGNRITGQTPETWLSFRDGPG